MRSISGNNFKRVLSSLFLMIVIAAVTIGAQAASLSPVLKSKLSGLADNVEVGTVIVAFNTTNGLQESHLNILRGVGITAGYTYPTLGMAAMPMTAGQVRQLKANPVVRSLWSNDKLYYYMHQARVLAGVARVSPTRR